MKNTELNSLRSKLGFANKKIKDLEKRLSIAYKDVKSNLDDFIKAEGKICELQSEIDTFQKRYNKYEEIAKAQSEKIAIQDNEIYNLKSKVINFEEKKAKMFTVVIADKIATQKMIRIMKNEYTHRAKARFANMFDKEIQTDVENMLSDINYTVNDLPF